MRGGARGNCYMTESLLGAGNPRRPLPRERAARAAALYTYPTPVGAGAVHLHARFRVRGPRRSFAAECAQLRPEGGEGSPATLRRGLCALCRRFLQSECLWYCLVDVVLTLFNLNKLASI